MQESKRLVAGVSSTTPDMRLKAYKRNAAEKGVAFELRDGKAISMMFQPCTYCGKKSPDNGHGITRLRRTEETSGAKCMGPYSEGNTATACAHCNLAKGHHTQEAFIEICRHIATHHNLGSFGRFPERFRNDISKKSR